MLLMLSYAFFQTPVASCFVVVHTRTRVLKAPESVVYQPGIAISEVLTRILIVGYCHPTFSESKIALGVIHK